MTLTLHAGQAGRLTVIRQESDPTNGAALIGAAEVEGLAPLMMRLDDNTGDLIAPAMPPGIHPFEIRAGGLTLAEGHFEVLPSPLESYEGEKAWTVQAADAPELAVITLNTEKGPKGDRGESAYEAAVLGGYEGTKSEWDAQMAKLGAGDFSGVSNVVTPDEMNEAVNSILRADAVFSTPAGTDDSAFFWASIPVSYLAAGPLLSIALHGAQNMTGAYDAPAYLSVWQAVNEAQDTWEPVGVSVNAMTLTAGAVHTWLFESATLRGTRIRMCLLDSNAQGALWRDDLLIRARVSETSSPGEGYVIAPAELWLLPQLEIKVGNVTGARFAEAAALEEHMQDDERHLNLYEAGNRNTLKLGYGAEINGEALLKGMAIGFLTKASGAFAHALGHSAQADMAGLAVGCEAKAGMEAVALGSSSFATEGAVALGRSAYNGDSGTLLLRLLNTSAEGTEVETLFYVLGMYSPLAYSSLNGEPGLACVVRAWNASSSSWEVLISKAVSFSQLMTDANVPFVADPTPYVPTSESV